MDVLPLFYFRYKYKLKHRKQILLDKYVIRSYELINILPSITSIPVDMIKRIWCDFHLNKVILLQYV